MPVHNAVCVTEYLEYLRNLCDLADVYISSKPIGCGIKFRVNKDDVTYVGEIEEGTPASVSEIKVGDELWQINGKDVYKWDFLDMAELVHTHTHTLEHTLVHTHIHNTKDVYRLDYLIWLSWYTHSHTGTHTGTHTQTQRQGYVQMGLS